MAWNDDLDAAWERLPDTPPEEFVALIAKLVDRPEVPPAIRHFHIAGSHDSTGRSDLAIPHYQRALDEGLSGYEGRRAKIQLASSLRNVGRADEGDRILAGESTAVGDGLDDAIVVFHALVLTDLGREREAVSRLVHALADHLPRYTASAHRYADALVPVAEEPR
ncbi:tetratricopeptide repeat protein [Saccharothrix obliqua]|uniref:tetratricopeptide repeat protein n=1 Tax=Saccharothrix obliqua TaxID=2861747 RepID=UPI001C5F943A|nr:tetratricopeptide repeat protein [Saccharothrix obliqua]MBW4719991.1 tetratricopeptide repeat protein [Saccharothrix obliqua]